jgi:hypothetical protein
MEVTQQHRLMAWLPPNQRHTSASRTARFELDRQLHQRQRIAAAGLQQHGVDMRAAMARLDQPRQ